MEYLNKLIGLKTAANKVILITTSDVKYQVLSYRNEHKIIDNLKIMTESEFITGFIYQVNPQNLMYLIKNNPWGTSELKPDLAKQLAKGLFLIDYLQLTEHELYSYLQTAIANGYQITKPKLPIDYSIEIYLPRVSDELHAVVQPPLLTVSRPPVEVLQYNYFLDEIEAAIEYIGGLVSAGESIDKIKVIAPSSYHPMVAQIAQMYNIPIAKKNELGLLAHDQGQLVYNQLISQQPLDFTDVDSLIAEPIVSIINQYQMYNDLNYFLPLIVSDFEHQTITLNTFAGLEVSNRIDSLYTNQELSENYFILLGNYQDGLITYMQDTNIVDDSNRQQLLNCDQVNYNENQILYNLLANANNLRVSFAKKLTSTDVELANNLSFCTIRNCSPITTSKYSQTADQLRFGRANYLSQVFNTQTDAYNYLSKYYRYQKRDNNFTGIERQYDNMQLSYTSINDFYKCSYKFYLNHVLRVKNGKFDSRKVVIGNIVHHVLENIDVYSDLSASNINHVIQNYVVENNIPQVATDQIYFNKLSLFLETVCSYMRTEEASNGFEKIEREASFEMELKSNIKLVGKIDKLLSKIEGDNLFVEIYDYKTGSITIDINGVEYGLNMQNLIYFLLIKDYYKHETGDEVLLGTYQQQIKQKLLYDEEEYLDMMKIKGYSKQKNEIIFKRQEKVISETEVEQLLTTVDTKVREAANNITDNQFPINPKIIDGKNVSCDYCPYISICNRVNDNYNYINTKE